MTYACPKDATHQSTDPDYCSICGAKIGAAPSLLPTPAVAAPAPIVAAATGELCPICSTPRAAGARFCEVCRHNFADPSQSSPSPPVVSAAPISAPIPVVVPVESTPPAMPVANQSDGQFEIAITVDASLYLEPDPNVPAPTDRGELSFPLDLADNLIGRYSSKNANKPEIPVGDPGASSRHAKISRGDDGSWFLLDLGSTNGTAINGRDVAAGVKTPLNEGDEVTLGCWSRLILRRVR